MISTSASLTHIPANGSTSGRKRPRMSITWRTGMPFSCASLRSSSP